LYILPFFSIFFISCCPRIGDGTENRRGRI
jgi:hypothetical protein